MNPTNCEHLVISAGRAIGMIRSLKLDRRARPQAFLMGSIAWCVEHALDRYDRDLAKATHVVMRKGCGFEREQIENIVAATARRINMPSVVAVAWWRSIETENHETKN